MTGNGCLVFPAKLLFVFFQNVITKWKIIFQKSKRAQIHLLMSINSFRSMAGYILKSLKINIMKGKETVFFQF